MAGPLTHQSPEGPGKDTVANSLGFCTVLTDSFLPGFAVLVHSLKKHNLGFDYPFIIFYHDELAPLSVQSRDLIQQLYEKAQFQHVDATHYSVVWSNRDGVLNTPERLKAAFFTLECFNLTGFEKVIFLDADMICMGGLHELVTLETDLAAVAAHDYEKGAEAGHYNSGLIVVGKRHLTGETYSALLKHSISSKYELRKGKADQAILNDFFRAEDIEQIGECFNTTKRKFPDSKIQSIGDVFDAGVRLLHFVGEKPWQLHASARDDQYKLLEQYWASQLEQAMPFSALLAHTRFLQTAVDSIGGSLATSSVRKPKSHIASVELRLSDSRKSNGPVEAGQIPSDGSVAFATAIDDAFVPGLECLLYSIRRQHPEFAAPFHVFHDEQLSSENRNYLKSIYTLFQFHSVDKGPYSDALAIHPYPVTPLFIFEAFRLPGSATIITLPADLLCLGNFSELCSRRKRLTVAWNGNRFGLPVDGANHENFRANSAVMVLPSQSRSHTAFQTMLQRIRKLMIEPSTGTAKEDESDKIHPDAVAKLRYTYNASIKLIHSKPNFDPFTSAFLHFSGDKPWNVDAEKDVPKSRRPVHREWHRIHGTARGLHRPAYYRRSGALDEVLELRNRHEGRRGFIIENGSSLAKYDLTKLNGEVTFVANRFALSPEAAKFTPSYYSITDPGIFGGWSARSPKLEDELLRTLHERTQGIPKFLPFLFRPYIESKQVLLGHKLRYLLFEPPLKRCVDTSGHYNLDPASPLQDGHSAVITFQMFLAHLMGIKEIYLIGCDYDDRDESSTMRSSDSGLAVRNGTRGSRRARIFETFRIAKTKLEARDIRIYNATSEGGLEVFPRLNYDTLFSGSPAR